MHHKPHRGCKNGEKRGVIMLFNQQTKVLLTITFYAVATFFNISANFSQALFFAVSGRHLKTNVSPNSMR